MVIVELHLIIAAITQLVVNVLLWWSRLCTGSVIGAQRVIMANLYPQDFSDICLYVCLGTRSSSSKRARQEPEMWASRENKAMSGSSSLKSIGVIFMLCLEDTCSKRKEKFRINMAQALACGIQFHPLAGRLNIERITRKKLTSKHLGLIRLHILHTLSSHFHLDIFISAIQLNI